MATTLAPLATPDDLQSFASTRELLQNQERWPPSAIAKLLLRATRSIESRCDRRLAPFTGLFESVRADGVDIEQVGVGLFPLDLQGAMGRSTAAAYGTINLIRDFWLREYPPQYQDLWTYDIAQVQVIRFWGDETFVAPSLIEGPEVDTGHFKVPLGTFLPTGSTVRVTYGGGYTVEIPDDLVQACIFQAMKLILIGNEPYSREGGSTAPLDEEITLLIAPFART